MKTKILLLGLIAAMVSSCSTPKYLPSSGEIDVNQYGSYIKIVSLSGKDLNGELIAVDTSSIIVLSEMNDSCFTIPVRQVAQFKLRYAKPKHYAGTIPMGILLPLINGWFSVFTLPIHLIVTVSVTASGEAAFKYSNKNMTYDKLQMFARFPQGLPPNVDLESIR
ncbi:MAG: hypothetical protein IPH88_18690 [Bacteroidales bacterium]|nr:hypothetical protein [Bacteroidales bacterium]